jgi:hypothetical protein
VHAHTHFVRAIHTDLPDGGRRLYDLYGAQSSKSKRISFRHTPARREPAVRLRTARCIELGTAAAQGDLPQEAPCADGWPRCQWSARPREREDCVQPGGRSRKAVIHRPRLLLQRYRWLGEGTRRSSGPSLNRTTPSTAWAPAIRAGAIACHALSVGGGQPLVSWPAASLMTPPQWREATAGRWVPQPWAICMLLPWMRGHSRAHPTAACPQTFSRAAGCHRSLASHALHVTPDGRVSDTQPRPANRTADLVFPTLLLHWAHSHRAALALHRITSHIASHLHRSLHRTCIAHCIAHCIASHSHRTAHGSLCSTPTRGHERVLWR